MAWPIILNISFITFLTLFIYPLFVIAMTKLIQNRDRRYFAKRRPSLVFAQLTCIALSNILELIIICNDIFSMTASPSSSYTAFLSPLAVSTLTSFDICLVLWVGFLFNIRVYIINYDHQIQKEAINHEWKQSLAAYNDRDINFFSSHKSTYGSIGWLMKRFGSAFCILCSMFFVLEFVLNTSAMTGYLVLSFIFSLEILCIIAIWIKFPYFNDKLFIRMELKECIKYSVSILLIGAVVVIAAQVSLSIAKESASYSVNVIALFMPWIQVLLLNGLTYICVLKVIMRNDEHESMQHNLQKIQNTPLSSPSSSPSTVIKYSMLQIISAKSGFETFINHLVQEWSSEHLLFLTELMQIKQSLNLSVGMEEAIDCKLNIEIPFTSAKYASPLDEYETDYHPKDANHDCKHFMNVIDKFYKKYIMDGSPYEINISWNARLNLCTLVDDRYITQPSLSKKRSRTFSRSPSIALPAFLRRESQAHSVQSVPNINGVVPSVPKINEQELVLIKNRKILQQRNDLKACISIILPLLEQCCFEVIPLLLTSFNRLKLSDDYVQVCNKIYNENRRKRTSLSKLGKGESIGRHASFSFSAFRKVVASASFSQLNMPKILGLSSQSSVEFGDAPFVHNGNDEDPLNQEQEDEQFNDPLSS